MIQEERDTEVGRAFRLHREATNKLACLMDEAHKVADLFGRLERIFSVLQPDDAVKRGDVLIRQIETDGATRAILSPEKLLSLLREIEDAISQRDKYLAELKSTETR
jgi:hypothetical protein